MRKPRLNSAVATVAVETVFSLLRVASLSFVMVLVLTVLLHSGMVRRTRRVRCCASPRNDGLHRAMGFHVKRVDGVAARHIEAVVLRSAESEVGAALRQPDEGERFTLGVEHHHAVEILRLALELEHLAAADFRGLALQSAITAPTAPQIAVAVDPESIQRALVGG